MTLAEGPFSGTILLAVLLFTLISLGLAGLILVTRTLLIPSGNVRITVNQKRTLDSPRGVKLLGALAEDGIFVSSACGGGGTCGQCRVKVSRGGGAILPTERSLISRRDARDGWRLSCQVAVKRDLDVEVPPEVFETKRWQCRVRSNRNVATYIKELVLELPEGEAVDFEAGGFIQIEVPPHEVAYADFDIDPEYRPEWERHHLFELVSRVEDGVVRAYSMANYPGEKGVIILNIRVCPPPPGAPKGTPPGKCSSWVFGLKPDDLVTISGPYGEFFIQKTDAEMIYVGGGAGMAPLRSHIFELLKARHSTRRISYWYGGRSLRELFYVEEFERLALEHENFSFHVVLSSPEPEDDWSGPTGFVHAYLYEHYLRRHPAPEDVEYYLCGPRVMIDAVQAMLDDLGVEPENIFFDDFGV